MPSSRDDLKEEHQEEQRSGERGMDRKCHGVDDAEAA
jgi:hypothetical protein